MFYRNDGLKDGVPHFTDVTKEAGLAREGKKKGHGFGVVAADLNGDGKIDLYVANDQTPAFTFLNNGDGTFKDVSELCGAAFNDDGDPQSGMGVDAEDLTDDGLPELIRTNFKDETTSVYFNYDAQFREQSDFIGVAAPSKPFVKWGCGLIDFDNDGYLDMFVTNGHVDDNHHLLGDNTKPYEEPPLLLRNEKAKKSPMNGRRFVPVGDGAGPYFRTGHVGRGSATGDLDDDGRPDLVVNHKDAAPAVLMNRTDPSGRWIRLDLQGTKSNRDAVGAKVEVVADGRTIYRQRKGGGSMESAHDPRLLIGVGPAKTVKVVVRWPSGLVSTVEKAETNRTIKLREGDLPTANAAR